MTDILELAKRVEAHTGGDDWALRVEIARALGWTKKQVGGVVAWYSPDQPDIMKAGPPKWLTSLDAAMTLVPEGFYWNIKHYRHDINTADIGGIYEAKASTPALALTAAALRAGETE